MAFPKKGEKQTGKEKAPPTAVLKKPPVATAKAKIGKKPVSGKDANRKPVTVRNKKLGGDQPGDGGGSANDRIAQELTSRVGQRVGKFVG